MEYKYKYMIGDLITIKNKWLRGYSFPSSGKYKIVGYEGFGYKIQFSNIYNNVFIAQDDIDDFDIVNRLKLLNKEIK